MKKQEENNNRVQLGVRLDLDTRRRFKALCASQGKSEQSVIETIILDILQRGKLPQ